MEMFEDSSSPAQKAYVSLANKYRPQTFEEVVGQESVSKTLMNAIKSGRIAHAYLFYGPRGCGKTTTARLLAKALNCTGGGNNKPTASPCGKCPQCLEIAASSDMDVLELDAASNTQVERVREAIIDTVALASGRDRYKVFILDEVHMLSTSSFNALLKTIEEPPAHVVFILATTELHKVPLTISSRCQTFRFKPITEEEITSHLLDLAGAENIDLEEEAAAVIAKSAGGALRDALTIFDRAISFSNGKVDKALVSQMLGILPQELVKDSVEAVIRKDGARLHGVFEKVKNEGFDSLSLLKDLKNAFGEIFYLSLNSGKEPYPGAKEILAECTPGHIAALTRKISKLTDEVKFSDTPALAAEVGLFTIMQNSIDIDGLISRLEALENSYVSSLSAPLAEKKSLNKQPVHTEPVQSAPKPVVKSFEEIKKEMFKADAPAMPEAAKILRPAVKTETPVTSFSASQFAASPLAEQKVQEHAAEPQANNISFSSAMEVWPSFKQELDKNYPFLYEGVLSASVSFPAKDEWDFTFKPKDGFFKDTLQRRIADLEKAALKVCGQRIKFNFKIAGGAPKEDAFSSTRTPAPSAFAPKYSSPRPAAATDKSKTAISAEEPFVRGDFSAYAQTDAPSAEGTKDAGPKTLEILDIFDGHIVG